MIGWMFVSLLTGFAIYAAITEINYRKFIRNIKPGDLVHIYLGEDRCWARVEHVDLKEWTAVIGYYNDEYKREEVSLDDIYP